MDEHSHSICNDADSVSIHSMLLLIEAIRDENLTAIRRPLASSMFAPSVPQVMTAFHSSNEQLATFVVSVYILGFAFGPLVIAPLSEVYGRLPVYHFSNLCFIVCTILCGESRSLSMLIVFRFLAGCFGATPMTLGGGTIADLLPPAQRARAMSIWSIGPLLGPSIG
jgi:MFS family permease